MRVVCGLGFVGIKGLRGVGYDTSTYIYIYIISYNAGTAVVHFRRRNTSGALTMFTAVRV